jgi:hypothetical protein
MRRTGVFPRMKMKARAGVFLTVMLGLASPAFAQHLHTGGTGLPHGIPDLCAAPTVTSAASGSFSNPATWSPQRVPGAGDRVSIAAGTTVTYDATSDLPLYCMDVSGSLRFRTDLSTRLTVGTLLVLDTGVLEIGTVSAPVNPGVAAELVIASTPLDTVNDPEQFGTGLLGLGQVTMVGAAKTSTFFRLSAEPHAGDAQLQLTGSPAGWAPGDRLILPDTRQLRQDQIFAQYVPQWEELVVQSVSGSTVRLVSPLQFDHLGGRTLAGALEYLPHVGNLTRNVTVRSANPLGVRGHVLFSQRATVDIRYIALKDLGRTLVTPLDSTTFDALGNVTHVGTNQIGRYSMHFHHLLGPAVPTAPYQYTFVGNAIDGTPKWGVTIHNSHFGLLRDNVIYNAGGSSLVTEDGGESFNVIDHNFAVRSTGTGGRQGMGREGGGFWFRGPNNFVTNNVAANIMSDAFDAAYGYKYYFVYLDPIRIPKAPGADTTDDAQVTIVPGITTPILQFDHNEVYGATEAGLTYWWVGAREVDAQPDARTSTFKNLVVWHVFNRGIFNYASHRVVIDGLIVRNETNADSACCSVGIDFSDYTASAWILRNSDIQGMRAGLIGSPNMNNTTMTIENTYFKNQLDIAVSTPFTVGYSVLSIPNTRRLLLTNTKLDTVTLIPGQPQASIQMAYQYEGPGQRTLNLTVRDEVYVYDNHGVVGDNFRLFYPEQAPAYVVPPTELNTDGTVHMAGAPVPGLTNQQTWSQYNVAIAGAVASCTSTRPGFMGFACGVTGPPPPLPGSSTRPSAPTNVHIVR